jgi:hypothetical protein
VFTLLYPGGFGPCRVVGIGRPTCPPEDLAMTGTPGLGWSPRPGSSPKSHSRRIGSVHGTRPECAARREYCVIRQSARLPGSGATCETQGGHGPRIAPESRVLYRRSAAGREPTGDVAYALPRHDLPDHPYRNSALIAENSDGSSEASRSRLSRPQIGDRMIRGPD